MLNRTTLPARFFMLVCFGLIAFSGVSVAGAQDSGNAAAEPASHETGAQKTQPAFQLEIVTSLNVAEWKIEAEQELTFFNRTSSPVRELVFYLPPNAVANDQALASGSLCPVTRARAMSDPSRLGYIDIREVRSAADVPFPRTSIELEGTTMRLALPATLPPGSDVELSMTFIVKLPDRALGLDGAGYVERHVDAFDWYPRPCTLTEEGWRLPCDGDTPAARGAFEVTITVPAQYHVEATGRLVESHVENAMKRVRYSTGDAHDFSWTANPLYTPEKNLYQGVEIVALAQPYTAEKTASLLNAAKLCVDFNREALLPYPHERFVISSTPYGAGTPAQGAMLASIPLKHPAHLDCLRDRSSDAELALLEAWARMTICPVPVTGEARGEAFHEGLARYLYLKLVDRAYAGDPCGTAIGALEQEVALQMANHGFGLQGSANTVVPGEQAFCGVIRPTYGLLNTASIIGFHESPFFDTTGTPSLLGYRVASLRGSGLHAAQWARVRDDLAGDASCNTGKRSAGVALALASLERQIGWDTMQKVLKAYLERRATAPPSMEALLKATAEYAGTQAASLGAALLHENARIDFAVIDARCTAPARPRGFVTQTAVGDPVEINLDAPDSASSCGWGCFFGLVSWGDGDAPPEQEDAAEPANAPAGNDWRWSVTVCNRGNTALPVNVRLVYEGGESELRSWDGASERIVMEGSSARRLLHAEVDPEQKHLLDLNRLNNRCSVVYEREGVLFLAGWFQFWVQNYLYGWAFLN